MKKEYLIPLLIIAALSAYLVLKSDDRSHYTLPAVPKVVADEVDRLIITQKDRTLTFTRTPDGWTVADQAYPADDEVVREMLDVMANLTLSALVSETEDLIRYDLDPDHAVSVTAFDGDTRLLSFTIGKTAPTFHHTFVMLENDPRVFHARDSFRNHFDKSLDAVRDKQVMTVDDTAVEAITVQVADTTLRLTARQNSPGSPVTGTTPPSAAPGSDKADAKTAGTAPGKPASADTADTDRPRFQYSDGTTPDPKTVSDLISTLSVLSCDAFLDDAEKTRLSAMTPDVTITLETPDPVTLSLYDTDSDKTNHPGLSSMSPYPFSLAGYTVEDIVSWARTLAKLPPLTDDTDTAGESGSVSAEDDTSGGIPLAPPPTTDKE